RRAPARSSSANCANRFGPAAPPTCNCCGPEPTPDERSLVIELPDVVRNRALAVGAHRWLTDLDELVGSLAADWGFTVGDMFHGGTEACVAAVTRDDGSPAVLKVLVPRSGAGVDDHEATVLRLAHGDGCPELFADDPARGA